MKSSFKILITFTFFMVAYAIPLGAKIEVLKERDRYRYKQTMNKRQGNEGLSERLKRLNQQNRRIENLLRLGQLKSRRRMPLIKDDTAQFNIKTGTILRGVLLNSILSTNLKSPVLIRFNSDPLKGYKINCEAESREQRVFINCKSLITEYDEYKVNTSILSLDGSLGLVGDEYPSQGSRLLRESSPDALKTVLDHTANKIGNKMKGSVTGKLLSKLAGKISETAENHVESIKTIYIESGKQILVYFNGRFKK